MSDKSPYFFVSYSRKDQDVVREIIEQLRSQGVNLYIDYELLKPGDNWELTIQQALNDAIGVIVFVSEASMNSPYVLKELAVSLDEGAKVYPVLLEYTQLPPQLKRIQWIDLAAGRERLVEINRFASALRQEAQRQTANMSTGLKSGEVQEITKTVVDELRDAKSPTSSNKAPDTVFVVHGRDNSFLTEVETFLQSVGVTPIVLQKMSSKQLSLFEKFLRWTKGEKVKFAVVLLSPDDFGAYTDDFKQDDRVLKFRARQNVILELGFFYGYLGWENVFLLFKRPSSVFPDFEFPSDLGGIPFDTFDANGIWKSALKERLKEHGFVIT